MPSTTAGASTTTAPATTVPGTAATSTAPPLPVYGLGSYMPLYPFSSLAAVQQWQALYRSGGHQPWHLDAGQTSLSFAGWLGYGNIDRVISTRTDSTGAHVAVGFEPEGTTGKPATAAVVHLIRWGTGTDAPWEVVGTDDTTLTLTKPAYRSSIASPVVVGGRISGVDESIRVDVHDLAAPAPVGSYCCLAAGGINAAWSVSVSYVATTGHVLTIAARTGGHVATVERFAVTGVWTR